uniref:50S ribosomal protein L31 n=1 Tax=Reclinomonas americana TaxID=48483 RepID=O21296_RECAM|nr:ribosomal protein L31 [Reclinomonas americana]AAD11926.1 ribosomal protein L31 [Reclinomonas americana]
MKKGIHPLKRSLDVIMTNGSFVKTIIVSSYIKKNLKLDIDTNKHPCWNPHKKVFVLDSSNLLQKFKSKYQI